jgi:predicted ATPase
LTQAIFRETGGNPLYVQEATRELLASGRVRVEGDRLATDHAAAQLGIPTSVKALVRERLGRIGEASAALVRLCSACAAPVGLQVLADAAGMPRADALDALDRALSAGILIASDRGCEPAHALIGRAVLESINPDRRAELHRRLAETLTDPGERARHYLASASLPGASAGVPFAVAAARAATASPAVAVGFWATACELAGGDDPGAELQCAFAVASAEALM